MTTHTPARRNEWLILAGLLAGSLLTLVVVVLFGRALFASPPPLPAPTATHTPAVTIITGAAVVDKVQRLARLETTSYSVQTVVSVERPGGFLGIGQQKVLIIVHGTVIAGVDLGKLKPADVTVSADGKRVTVRLPQAEILSSYLDEGGTQLYDHQTGLFTRPDSSLVIEAQQMGISRILEAACQDGVMQRATDDGQRALSEILRAFGFEGVEFEKTAVPPCPDDV
jgi:hypothetical protein